MIWCADSSIRDKNWTCLYFIYNPVYFKLLIFSRVSVASFHTRISCNNLISSIGSKQFGVTESKNTDICRQLRNLQDEKLTDLIIIKTSTARYTPEIKQHHQSYFVRLMSIATLGKISAQPHPTLCIQFLNRGNNDKKKYISVGKTDLFYNSMGLCGNFTLHSSTGFIVASGKS